MTKKVQIDVGKSQSPTDYYVVLVELVHVKKGLFGFVDKTLVKNACIPDTREHAAHLTKRFTAIMQEYGGSVTHDRGL